MKKFGIYILESQKNKMYYVGSTGDVDRRLWQHNSGLVGATKFFRPWNLKVFIECNSQTEAKQSEYRLKKYKSRKILEETWH